MAAILIVVVALAFLRTEGAAFAHPTPDPVWVAMATRQQQDFLATSTLARTPRAQATPSVAPRTPTVLQRPSSTIAPPATPTATTAPAVTAAPAAAPPTTTPTEVPPTEVPPTESSPTERPTPTVRPMATVGVSAINLRAGPGLGFPVIGVLGQGAEVELTGERQVGDDYLWVAVVTADGRRGWLLADAVGAR